MATDSGQTGNDDSLYPIAVLIDELRNDELQVSQCECAFWLCVLVFVFVALSRFPFAAALGQTAWRVRRRFVWRSSGDRSVEIGRRDESRMIEFGRLKTPATDRLIRTKTTNLLFPLVTDALHRNTPNAHATMNTPTAIRHPIRHFIRYPFGTHSLLILYLIPARSLPDGHPITARSPPDHCPFSFAT